MITEGLLCLLLNPVFTCGLELTPSTGGADARSMLAEIRG